MQDVIVAEAEAFGVPELRVCQFLVLVLNLLILGIQRWWEFSLNKVCRLELVRPLHLEDHLL